MNPLTAILSLIVILPVCVFADDQKTDAAPPAEKQEAPPIVNSKDIDAIRAHDGQKVVMRGKVIRSNEWDGRGDPKKSMNFLDLDGGYFTIVTWADAYSKFTNGHPAALYRGKIIEVTGTISKHNNRFQMKLEDPGQVKVVEAADSSEDQKGKDKKDGGKDKKDGDKDKKNGRPEKDQK